MKPDDPKPYDNADLALVATMDYVHEDNSGDRLYSYDVRQHTRPGLASPAKQVYFYRAMKRAEALGWLAPTRNAQIDAAGHQPFASYRKFSLDYLTRRHGYTHLVEIHAPGFIQWMLDIGFNSGKIETDDISWGIGGACSNGFQANAASTITLRALYAKVCNNGVAIHHTAVRGGLKAMAKAVAPYVFRQSIKWVKLVNLRSQKP